MGDSQLLYKTTNFVKVGDIHRYVITYTPKDINSEIGSHLYIKIKNTESILINPAVLNGPYILYCDIRSDEYDHNKPCFVSDDQPIYDPNVIAGQSLTHKLTLNKLKNKYVWIVEVISQIVFSTTSEINFEIILSRDESTLNKNHSHVKNGNFSPVNLDIQHLSTLDIWNNPPKSLNDPVHLVILTHGLHSNTSADMFYIKEQLENMAHKTGENIVVRGYFGNVCRTERGIKYLGRRLAEYIVNDMIKSVEGKIDKISFIGHSLGGPVQTFAISYIDFNYPDFFKKYQPENFVTMASPMLGISNENPAYVKMFLTFGIVGKTGQDLNLDGNQPLLLLLPSNPTRKILKRFKRRTVYANVLNDGIVPLRTSALLYLDWKGLSKVYETISGIQPSNNSQEQTSEIPEDIDNLNGTINYNENNYNNNSTNNKFNNEYPSADVDFVGSIKNKIQSTISYCLPNMQVPKTTHKYNYYQTGNEDDSKTQATVDTIKEVMTSIPKSSVITSLKRIILPPSPSSKYINDPKSRYNVILHDKFYTPDMIPKKHTLLSKNVIISQLELKKKHKFFEEKIARRWHDEMVWRKVLVYLQPDAHNNMIVRRRFANAYGWQVVDHLIEEHFGEKCFKQLDISSWELKDNKRKVTDLDETEIGVLSDKLAKVMNKEHKREIQHTNKENTNDRNDKKNDEKKDVEIEEPRQVHLKENDNYMTEHTDSELYTRILNRSNYEEDGEDGEEHSDSEVDQGWVNEVGSGYYDGPTGLINCVHEGVASWTKGNINNDDSTQQSDKIEDSAFVNSSDYDLPDKVMRELNEVGEINAYL